MALLFFDGFDEYSTDSDCTTYGEWYSYGSLTFSNSVSLRSGASGNYANISGSGYLIRQLNSGTYANTVYLGYAVRFASFHLSGIQPIVTLSALDSSNAFFAHCNMSLGTDGSLYIYDKTNGNVDTGYNFSTGTWYSIELELYSHDTAGTVDIRVNGSSVYSVSSVDTKYNSTNSYLVFTASGGNQLLDDVRMFDDTGSFSNTWAGDLFDVDLGASGDNSVQFTPLSGSNYANIDEGVVHDSDTTYVQSSTTGHRDLYDLNNPSISVDTCYGVKVSAACKLTDASAFNIKIGGKTGTDEVQSSAIAATSSYVTSTRYWDNKDGGTTAFSASDLDAMTSVIEVA